MPMVGETDKAFVFANVHMCQRTPNRIQIQPNFLVTRYGGIN